jgi:hypothetical protein
MTWGRVTHMVLCGLCREWMRKGDPVLFVTTARLRRCAACAATDYQLTPPEPSGPAVASQAPLTVRTPAGWVTEQRPLFDTP